jgi:hypothetical protein
MYCSTTAMKRNVRPAPANDLGALGSIAVFDDDRIRRIFGFSCIPEGKFLGDGETRCTAVVFFNLAPRTGRGNAPGFEIHLEPLFATQRVF